MPVPGPAMIILPFLAAVAIAAEPSFEDGLKAVEQSARKAAAEAPAVRAPARPRGVCRFEYTRPIQLDVLMPEAFGLGQLGIEVREDNGALELRVDPALPGVMSPDSPVRLLRLREQGVKGRRLYDLRIEPGDGRGGGGIYFGAASEDGKSFKHAENGFFGMFLQFSPGAALRQAREFTWGFLGFGSRTRLLIDCRNVAD